MNNLAAIRRLLGFAALILAVMSWAGVPSVLAVAIVLLALAQLL